MNTKINKENFGPWVLITGASSGIGKEFANQLAGQGFNLVLVSRRAQLLESIANALESKFAIETRVIEADLSDEDFLESLSPVTDTLDIGLVISNAGIAHVGEFIKMDLDQLRKGVSVNVMSHLTLAHHFGEKLAQKKRGGIVLLSAMGSANGVPFMANSAATKAYVFSLGQGLHTELKRAGVSVLIVSPGATDTPAMGDLGFRPEEMPMKPMGVSQCVEEALIALDAGKAHIIPGRINRIMKALIPSSISRNLFSKLLAKANGITIKCFFFLLILYAKPIHAQPILRLSLAEAIKTGLDSNKSIRATTLDSEADIYKTKRYTAALYPSVDGNAGFVHYLNVPVQYAPASVFNPAAPSHEYAGLQLLLPNTVGAGITVNWTLFNQAVFAGLKIISEQNEVTGIHLQKDRNELAFAISQLYYGIVFAEKQRHNLIKIAENMDRLISLLQISYENGVLLRSELDKVKVNKTTTTSQIDELTTAIASRTETLKLLTGISANTQLELTENDFEKTLQPITNPTTANAENTFDLQLMREQIKINQLERKAIQATNIPKVGATYNYSYNVVSPEFNKTLSSPFHYPAQYVGLNITVPLFSGGSNGFSLKENAVRNRQLNLQQEFLEQKINTDIGNARLRYNSNLVTMISNRANANLAQELYDQSLEQYRQGTILLTDVLTFESSLEQALTQYFNSVSNALIAVLEYRNATNTILTQ